MATQEQMKDLIFGSYNRRDLAAVQAIKAKLQQNGIEVWLDTQQLLPGTEWMAELEAVILRSKAAIIFKGPFGFGNFQREEISALFKLHADQKLLLVPALLPGASGKDAGLFLGNIQHVDFRLRVPNPLSVLISVLGRDKLPTLRPSEAANPLVQWIVKDMDNLQELDRYGSLYIAAHRWPEALYIYHRLAKLAISKSDRIYADSYVKIGYIYFLKGDRNAAEKKWEISFRIYHDRFQSELPQLKSQIDNLKAKVGAYSASE